MQTTARTIIALAVLAAAWALCPYFAATIAVAFIVLALSQAAEHTGPKPNPRVTSIVSFNADGTVNIKRDVGPGW